MISLGILIVIVALFIDWRIGQATGIIVSEQCANRQAVMSRIEELEEYARERFNGAMGQRYGIAKGYIYSFDDIDIDDDDEDEA